MLVLTNTLPTLVTGLPASHKLRKKLEILSVAPLVAHRMCEFAGLPPPDVSAYTPTFPLHGGGTAADDSNLAYLQRGAGSPGRRPGLPAPDSSFSLFDGTNESFEHSPPESTTASEYSAYN